MTKPHQRVLGTGVGEKSVIEVPNVLARSVDHRTCGAPSAADRERMRQAGGDDLALVPGIVELACPQSNQDTALSEAGNRSLATGRSPKRWGCRLKGGLADDRSVLIKKKLAFF